MFNFFRKKPQLTLSVQFVVEPDGDRFHAYSPILSGLHADGDTQQEACDNFVSEINAYLESLAKHGEPLPVGVLQVVHEPTRPKVPAGAFLSHIEKVTVKWPSMPTFGIS